MALTVWKWSLDTAKFKIRTSVYFCQRSQRISSIGVKPVQMYWHCSCVSAKNWNVSNAIILKASTFVMHRLGMQMELVNGLSELCSCWICVLAESMRESAALLAKRERFLNNMPRESGGVM